VPITPNRSTPETSILAAALTCVALSAVACGGNDPAPAGGSFWPDAYNPSGLPTPAKIEQQHPTGASTPACLTSGCHGPGGAAVLKLDYGGTVFQADGKTPAPNVQVGVVSGNYKSFVYSWNNGMYWQPAGTTAIDWSPTVSDIRIRNAKGERPKLTSQARGADCDMPGCHVPATTPLTVLP
jgi:hypothetical protein